MNTQKSVVYTHINFNNDLNVIKQLQINKYGIEKYFFGLMMLKAR